MKTDQTLTNAEALRALSEGKKIATTYWTENHYVFMSDKGIILTRRGIAEDWNELASCFMDTWIIVE